MQNRHRFAKEGGAGNIFSSQKHFSPNAHEKVLQSDHYNIKNATAFCAYQAEKAMHGH